MPPRSPRRPLTTALGGLLLVVALLAGCGGGTGPGPVGDGSLSGELTVSAAASLSGAFDDAGAAFEAIHPQVRVTVNPGASSTLAGQLVDGAPVDAFASADRGNMARVADAGLLDGAPVVFATNTLQIIVPRDNPKGITGLADLASPGVVFVTCPTEVPIGRYTAQVLARAGVTVTPRSLEADVKGIVAKVVAGEADAGIVYATDITATRGAAIGIDIPTAVNVTAEYPIAVMRAATNPSAARAWIDFLLSEQGEAILRARGFGTP